MAPRSRFCDTAERFRGALLGLAVGDALGTTGEFRPPGTFAEVTDITGGGPFRLPPGAWTDDTSMALRGASFGATSCQDVDETPLKARSARQTTRDRDTFRPGPSGKAPSQ